VDDGLSVRKNIKVVLQCDGFQTNKKVDLNPMVISLVEDDLGVQSFVWELLKDAGVTVLTVGDGVAALEESRNYLGSIDLLLSDVEMPRMGGLELCKLITAERPRNQSAHDVGCPSLGREQVSMSGLPFLQKPFTHTALRSAIETLLGPILPLR